MLKKFSEAQEKGYNYMLFIELGYLTSKNDLSSFQVKAVTIEGYFETIKQIYDYVENKKDFEYEEDPIKAYNLALSKKRKLTVCCGSFYILIKLKEGLNG